MGRKALGKGQTPHGFYNSGGTYPTRVDGIKLIACRLWENIRIRCQILPNKDESRFGKYSEVSVCEDWKDYQNFAKWVYDVRFYKRGWELDKDLLFKGNKIYSPDTCVFLPKDLNKALNTKTRTRGDLPLGLSWQTPDKKAINVQFSCKDSRFNIRFSAKPSDVESSFLKYKEAREGYVKSLGEKYKEDLDPRAYEALMRYEVSIDD